MMSDKITKSEAIASDSQNKEDWQIQVAETLSVIGQLSDSIGKAAQSKEQDPAMAQWVMQRGEMIQRLIAFLTPDRISQLAPELSASLQEKISVIQQADNAVSQSIQTSMASIHQQLLGLQQGKSTLRGYHLSPGNQSSYTRSNDV